MLDLLISFFHLLALYIKKVISRFVFRPPNPQGYKIDPSQNDKLLFLRSVKEKKYEPLQFGVLDIEYVRIQEDKYKSYIPGILIKPRNPFKICIIYSHGNSGDIGTSILETLSLSINTNCCVLSYEYPGYSECRSIPLTEENVYYNIIKTYEYAREVLNYRSSEIILYGFSLGTGICFDLASRNSYPIAGLILQAPFLSIVRTMYSMKQTRFFDFFSSIDKAKNIHCPVMIIHGNKDTIVPYIHGKILSKKIPKEYMKEFVTIQDADHNNIFKINKDFIYEKVRNFIMNCSSKDYLKSNKHDESGEFVGNISKSEIIDNKRDNEEQKLNDIHLEIDDEQKRPKSKNEFKSYYNKREGNVFNKDSQIEMKCVTEP
jgi:esterase/lipase